MPAIITLQDLVDNGACADQRAEFVRRFGRSVEITVELCMSVAHVFDWNWAAAKLLKTPAWDAYEAATKPARDAYEAAKKTAWDACKAATKPAWAAYEAAKAKAFAEAFIGQNSAGEA